MQRRNIRPSAIPAVLPVAFGGTASQTAQAARTALGFISSDSLGQPNGLAVLDQQNKLSATIFSGLLPYSNCVSGPAKIFTDSTVQFEITDFDSFVNYVVSASVGTVDVSGSTITYIAPAVAQAGGFTLNGREVSFDVLPPQPDQPTITTPIDGSVGVGDSLQATASAFVALGAVFTHQSSDWQVATDAAFTNVISQITDSTVNKTTWTITNPSTSTVYYLRVRYKGSNGNYGAWSPTVSYTTKASFFPVLEEAAITKNMTAMSAPSPNGTTVIIGSMRINTVGSNYGGFYIYTKTNGSWVQDFVFQSTGPDDGAGRKVNVSQDGTKAVTMRSNSGSVVDSTGIGVGEICSFSKATGSWVADAVFQTDRNYYAANVRDVAMSHDHTRIAYCGTKRGTLNDNNVVLARVYVRSGNTWVGEANLEASVGMRSAFANCCLMSGDGTTIVITAQQSVDSGSSHRVVHTYKRSGSTWTKLADFTNSESNLSIDAALSLDGNTLALCTSAIVNGKKGAVRIYKLISNVWTQEGVIENPVNTTTGSFAASLACNADATKFMVSDTAVTVNGFVNAGVVYNFNYAAGVVTYAGSFNAVEPATNGYFGAGIWASTNFSRFTTMSNNKTYIFG